MDLVVFFLEMSYFKSAVQFAFLSIFEFSDLGVLAALIGSRVDLNNSDNEFATSLSFVVS